MNRTPQDIKTQSPWTRGKEDRTGWVSTPQLLLRMCLKPSTPNKECPFISDPPLCCFSFLEMTPFRESSFHLPRTLQRVLSSILVESSPDPLVIWVLPSSWRMLLLFQPLLECSRLPRVCWCCLLGPFLRQSPSFFLTISPLPGCTVFPQLPLENVPSISSNLRALPLQHTSSFPSLSLESSPGSWARRRGAPPQRVQCGVRRHWKG